MYIGIQRFINAARFGFFEGMHAGDVHQPFNALFQARLRHISCAAHIDIIYDLLAHTGNLHKTG